AEIANEKRNGVAYASERRHGAAYQAPDPGMTSPSQAAIVGEGFGKAHADASANGSGETDDKGIPTIAGGERRGEDGRERRDRAVHQAGKAGLNNLQNKQAAVGFLFFGLDAGGELFFFERIGTLFVAALLVGQIVQQLPNAGVLRTPSSLL